MTTIAKPFIRWAGGKRQLLPELLALVPKFNGVYHEPMVGGGALFFALRAQNRIGDAHLSDILNPLVNTYNSFKYQPEDLHWHMNENLLYLEDYTTLLGDKHKAIKHLYQERRNHLNSVYVDTDTTYSKAQILTAQASTETAAAFIFINKMGYNGLYRENKKGYLNTPIDNTKTKYTPPSLDYVKGVSAALQHTYIFCNSYHNILVEGGDFVYFDPPYVPVSKTANFTTYTKSGFGWEEHTKLHDFAKKIADAGVLVMLSNSDTPEVRELYKDFKLHEVQARRNINSVASKRGKVGELIITSY